MLHSKYLPTWGERIYHTRTILVNICLKGYFKRLFGDYFLDYFQFDNHSLKKCLQISLQMENNPQEKKSLGGIELTSIVTVQVIHRESM